jgi:hypothetical protein
VGGAGADGGAADATSTDMRNLPLSAKLANHVPLNQFMT